MQAYLRSKILTFFAFSSFLSLPASECAINSNYVQKWTSLYVSRMTPEELQVIANFLYSLYGNALVDLEIQKYCTPLSRLQQSARINLSDPNNSGNELIRLKALIEKLASLVRIRFIYTKTLDHCLKKCNESNSSIIKDALSALQLHASESLHAWAHQNGPEFANHLERSTKSITECEQSMHFASGFHRGLSCGELPIVVEDKDKPLAIINLVLQGAPSFIHTADVLANSFNDICDQAMKIIELGTEVYKNHYKALYDYMIMTDESSDKKYATLLNDCFMLPDEYHVILPDVDHVAEHMTKTAELLAQTTQ